MKKQLRLLVIIFLFVAAFGTLFYVIHQLKPQGNTSFDLEKKATKNNNFRFCNSSGWEAEIWALEVTIYENDFIYQSNYSIINNSSGNPIITGTRVRQEPNLIQKTTQNLVFGEHGHTEYANNRLLSEIEDKALVAKFGIGVWRNNRLGLIKLMKENFIQAKNPAKTYYNPKINVFTKQICAENPESDRSMILDAVIVILPNAVSEQPQNFALESMPKGTLLFTRDFAVEVSLIDGKTNFKITNANIEQETESQAFQTNSENGTVKLENSDNGHPIPLNHFSFKFQPILKSTRSISD